MAQDLGAKSFRSIIGVPPNKATTADSAVLIIDAQGEYENGILKTENIDSTRAAIASLLETYRSASSTKPENIIHITHQVPAGAPVFTPDTPLAEEFAELKPRDGEKVVVKQFPGSFTGTSLAEHLEKNGVKKVVLAGYMAHVCVSTTARQAAERGYEVLIVKEAVGDRSIPGVDAETLKEVTLRELDDAFGTVISLDQIK